LSCLPYTINHPRRHPGPKYLLVNPEHLKIVTSPSDT